jgi:hypothetical protein
LLGETGPALPNATEALQLADQMENPYLRAQALTALGWVNAFTDELEPAERRLREALALHESMGNEPFILDVLMGLARVAVLTGDLEQAAMLVHLATTHPAADLSLHRLAPAVWRGVQMTAGVQQAGIGRANGVKLSELVRAILAAGQDVTAGGVSSTTTPEGAPPSND